MIAVQTDASHGAVASGVWGARSERYVRLSAMSTT
jgi:hypothetical protein